MSAGDIESADSACASLLINTPDHADAWHMRGTISLQGGGSSPPDFTVAAKYFETAVELSPDEPKYHHGLGLACRSGGDDERAIASLEKAIRLKPDFAEAIFEIAAIHESLGARELAARTYLGAIECRPGFLEAHHNLSGVYRRLGQTEEALAHARMALAIAHDNPVVRFSLAVALEQSGDLEDAVIHYREAIRLRPDYVQAENNLGRLYEFLGRAEDAIGLLSAASIRNPENSNLLINLGNAYLRNGDPNRAKDVLSRAQDLSDDSAALHNSLAIADTLLGNEDAAAENYRSAVRLNPDFAEAHENLAQALLSLGSWPEGWEEYEWRWKNPVNSLTRRNIQAPIWDGTPLNGRTLLLHAEQGLGDTIQMIRYAPLIEKSGGRIVLACQQPLIKLLASVAGIDLVIAMDGEWPEPDCHAPLFSLPRLFGTTIISVPNQTPYINGPKVPEIDVPLVEGRHRVAITWAGRRKFTGDPYRDRSCPFEKFATLATRPDMDFFSLQRAIGPEISLSDSEIVDLSEKITDFEDDAAVLAQVDLVITIDTALAHLAGAMNVPCWVALPFSADWRWSRERDDSVWYPSIRLFRQSAPGDWDGVFSEIENAILVHQF